MSTTRRIACFVFACTRFAFYVMCMSGEVFDSPRLRATSKCVFGQDYRLGILLVFARSPAALSQTDVARALGVANPSSIHGAFKDVRDAGFIRDVTVDPRQRSRMFAKQDSLVWAFAEELADRVVSGGNLFAG